MIAKPRIRAFAAYWTNCRTNLGHPDSPLFIQGIRISIALLPAMSPPVPALTKLAPEVKQAGKNQESMERFGLVPSAQRVFWRLR